VLRGLRLHRAGAFGDTVLTQHLQVDGRNAQSRQMRSRRGRAFVVSSSTAKRRVSRRRCIILTSLIWARRVDGDASAQALLSHNIPHRNTEAFRPPPTRRCRCGMLPVGQGPPVKFRQRVRHGVACQSGRRLPAHWLWTRQNGSAVFSDRRECFTAILTLARLLRSPRTCLVALASLLLSGCIIGCIIGCARNRVSKQVFVRDEAAGCMASSTLLTTRPL
jgi:hypothetical protein